MHVRNIDDADQQVIDSKEASGVTMRVPIGAREGAPNFTMRLLDIESGGHTPRHSHEHEHEIIVRSGSGILRTAGGEMPLVTDTVALVLPKEEHQFVAGPDGMSMWCIVPNSGHKY
jgi:quercetin dioxygenase-like cupin family protein